MGEEGLRVLGAATAVSDRPDTGQVTGLTLTAVAGITDPPRPQARDAVALAQAARRHRENDHGDHADTATAIARELGITGDVVTGAELTRMGEQDLADRVEGIGVFARVAPEHKVSIVRALSRRGHIVAMTGDGVNDAAALRAAHIGVAMGVTGTDVAKEAADMVLTDDDFSTIVRAVREGRSIYDNIVTFVRFQLSTNIGAILTLLATVLAGLPAPMSAIQLLWVNIIMDGPPAMALGIDPPRDDVMRRPPRPPGERILNGRRLIAITRSGVVMAAGTVAVFASARALTDDTATATTMAFTTFVLFQLQRPGRPQRGRPGAGALSAAQPHPLDLPGGSARPSGHRRSGPVRPGRLRHRRPQRRPVGRLPAHRLQRAPDRTRLARRARTARHPRDAGGSSRLGN